MSNLSKPKPIHLVPCLAALLSMSLGQVAAAAPQQLDPVPAVPPQLRSILSDQNSSKGASGSAPVIARTSDGPEVASSQNAGQTGTGSSEPSSRSQQNGAPKPVGTAAAPYEKTTGVAASRPAGAAIAPAKQRRVRSFLIKLGVVVGAGVALGTVAALSHASPSRPH
jgi:hypothetical protein